MGTLADRIREQRKVEVKIGDITLFATVSDDSDIIKYMREGTDDQEVIKSHVYGWSGVKERDLIDGGSDDIVAFDKEVFDLSIKNKIDWWAPSIEEIFTKPWKRLENKLELKKK
ncbi:MAG: hypothetical protein KAZ14_00030 [Nitrosomonas sp.]|nr:hypothetical protein [Nitrosomonas sp.]